MAEPKFKIEDIVVVDGKKGIVRGVEVIASVEAGEPIYHVQFGVYVIYKFDYVRESQMSVESAVDQLGKLARVEQSKESS